MVQYSTGQYWTGLDCTVVEVSCKVCLFYSLLSINCNAIRSLKNLGCIAACPAFPIQYCTVLCCITACRKDQGRSHRRGMVQYNAKIYMFHQFNGTCPRVSFRRSLPSPWTWTPFANMPPLTHPAAHLPATPQRVLHLHFRRAPPSYPLSSASNVACERNPLLLLRNDIDVGLVGPQCT